ncbi:MAG: hypothetical protein J6D03_10935 [Clostridia bacterium]|nr:hypothetical protein [Clostridia bacterium]
MKEYRVLNINGAVLNKNQLENYLQKVASSHILKNKSDKNTYPIPRVKENYEFINMVYILLNEHLKSNIPIHPAGEWILDNFYIIEKTVKTIIRDLSFKKYENFLGISNGNYKGFARIYVLASEIIAYTDSKIDGDILSNLLKSYQNKNTLSMDEIWNIGLFLQIALIEKIRGLCEKIYSSQMQKYKAENIIERLVENKKPDVLKYKNLPSYKTKILGYGEMKYPFIEYMSYRLKSYGKQSYSFLKILENQVEMMGTNITEVIKKEHFDIAVKKVSMGNSITSINTILRINFLEIFEEINGVEEILKNDPVKIYENMDYKTKIYYRDTIKDISKKTKISEIYIAKKCLDLAQNSYNKLDIDERNLDIIEDNNKVIDLKKSHIGYYLIDDGKQELLSNLLNKKIKFASNEKKAKIYISSICIISFIFTFILMVTMYFQNKNIIISVILGLLILIPIQTIVTQITQYLLSKLVSPKMIPKLDFTNGIPKANATMVIIPTIIKSKDKTEELMKKLEVYYLANKSENLYFTLLGDCSSSDKEVESFDDTVIKAGVNMVNLLNEKYKDENFPKFNFIYRERFWNEGEAKFLGWERKRGFINQFNSYILGKAKNPFKTNTIEDWKKVSNSKIPKIKYIITLDSDTDLVLNSGLELVRSYGTCA